MMRSYIKRPSQYVHTCGTCGSNTGYPRVCWRGPACRLSGTRHRTMERR